jgi:hypothetical protein
VPGAYQAVTQLALFGQAPAVVLPAKQLRPVNPACWFVSAVLAVAWHGIPNQLLLVCQPAKTPQTGLIVGTMLCWTFCATFACSFYAQRPGHVCVKAQCMVCLFLRMFHK